MKTNHLLSAAVLALAGWLAPPETVKADQLLLDDSGFISGTQSFVDSFDVATAGTLTVTLSDIGWPDTMQNLNFFVSSANGVLAPTFGPGTDSISVGPGLVSLHWYGTATGTLQLGLFGIEAVFQPLQPVPLPPAALLLASGLAMMVLWRRARRSPGMVCASDV